MIKFDDVAAHIRTIPNRQASTIALLDAIASGLSSVSNTAQRDQLVRDLESHRPALLDAIESGLPGSHTNLGPGETPLMPGDVQVSAADAENFANPILPRDLSGHKVHPADAFGGGAGGKQNVETNVARSQGFGGDGLQRPADLQGNVTSERVEPISGDTIVTTTDAEGNVVDVQRKSRAAGVVEGQKNGPVL